MTARKHDVPAGFTEGPARFFAPVCIDRSGTLGLRGFPGGPSGWEEVESLDAGPIVIERGSTTDG